MNLRTSYLFMAALGALTIGQTYAYPSVKSTESTATASEVVAPSRLTPSLLQKLLVAEFAIQQGQSEIGYALYKEAAEETKDSAVAERAFTAAQDSMNEELSEEALAVWTSIDPNNRQVQRNHLYGLLAESNFQEAEPLAESLLKDARNPLVELDQIAKFQETTEQRTAFYDFFAKIIQPHQDDPRAQLLLARVASDAKQIERAAEHATKAMDMAPDSHEILLLGIDYEYRINAKKASERLSKYIDKHPGQTNVRLSYAKALITEGNLEALQKELRAIEDTNKNNPRVLFMLGMVAEEASLYSRAELYYKKYLLQIAKHPEPTLLADNAYVRIGMVKLSQGNVDLAIQWLHKVEKGDKYLPARVKEAQLLAQTGKVTEACNVVRTIRTTDNQRAELLQGCADLLAQNKEFQEALKTYQEAYDLNPVNMTLVYRLGTLAAELGDIARAESMLSLFIQRNPNSPDGYNALGYLWLTKASKLTAAKRYIEKAVALSHQQDPHIMDSLGWLRYKEGKFAESEAILRSVVHQMPNEPEILLHLAQALMAQHKFEEASTYLKRALTLDPQNKESQSLLNLIPKDFQKRASQSTH